MYATRTRRARPEPFALRPGFALTLLALALGIAILAAYPPARRAAQLDAIQAMRRE